MLSGSPRRFSATKMRSKKISRPTELPKSNETRLVSVDRNFLHGGSSCGHFGGICRGRPYWTLACPPSTCSGWDGHSFQRRSSISDSSFALPPAGFLQTDTRVHHTVTQDSPSRGAVTGHSQITVHTSRSRQQNTGVKNQLQNNPDGNNI